MDPELMSWVGICMTACLTHDGAHCHVAKKLVRTCVFLKNTQGFLCRNLEIGRTTENRKNRVDGIKDRMIQVLELVVSKSDGDGADPGLGMIGQYVLVSYNMHSMIAVKGEVISDESKRVSCPFAGIDRYRDGIEADSSLQM
jgi:hypothetical protein